MGMHRRKKNKYMTLCVHARVGTIKIASSAKLLDTYKSYGFITDLTEAITNEYINAVRLVSTGASTGFIVMCKDSHTYIFQMYMYCFLFFPWPQLTTTHLICDWILEN